ncbi:methionyl-tRNA formyltransferase [Moraxella macacae 0408225]|uniref:Methionyl-tRNA formyltransferase n=1 Tax=Moraxella macacae 0408225 TaxID=1230338 RepID=L2F9L6_9GAMM|nr:methionyl-tRNA formyltransferase [Moraxella macacae]ELA09466.1 methionyl-tRNA formyltransferase [Moraxella macacae 0408225]
MPNPPNHPKNTPLNVIFAGTPEFASIALKSLIDNQDTLNIKIVAVYTQPDRKAGRGQKLSQSPVKKLALTHNIPVEQPISFSLKTNAGQDAGQVARHTLANYKPDVMIVAAYGLILPLGVLNTPTFGCVNIHASLLPRFRGAAPIQRAILANDAQTGITIMQMDKGLDTGDMLYKAVCDIDNTDTTQSLHDKLATLGGQAIVTVLKDLPKYQSQATKQDDTLANYANKITTDEGLIDWQNDAFAIHRQIRALNAFTFLKNERIKVLSAKPIKLNQTTQESAGKVVSVGKNAILVACGQNQDGIQHLINLTHMQWAGGKPLTAEQIANGDKLNDGDMFGSGFDGGFGSGLNGANA